MSLDLFSTPHPDVLSKAHAARFPKHNSTYDLLEGLLLRAHGLASLLGTAADMDAARQAYELCPSAIATTAFTIQEELATALALLSGWAAMTAEARQQDSTGVSNAQLMERLANLRREGANEHNTRL